jgi:CBS-domain-containing membrane protein
MADAIRHVRSAEWRRSEGNTTHCMPKKSNHNPAPAAPPLQALATEKAGALDPQDTVQTAGERMRQHDAEAWPVAEDRKLVGTVAGKNPDWELGGRGHDPKVSRVGQIMNRDVIFCYEDEDCAVARQKMEKHGLQVLPVVDRELRIVGIFTRDEIEEKAKSRSRPGQTAAGDQVRPAFEA